MKSVPVRPIHRLGLPLGLGLGLVLAVLFMAARLQQAAAQASVTPPTVSKSANPTSLDEPGGTVQFTVVVTNNDNSNVDLTALTDSVYGNLAVSANPLISTTTCDLTANAAKNIPSNGGYSCTFTALVPPGGSSLTGTYTDTVTATVRGTGQATASGSDSATVTINNVNPSITVSKSATPTLVESGSSVTFTVVITNDSVSTDPVTVTGLVDVPYGNLAGEGTCVTGTVLAANASYQCTFTATVVGSIGELKTDTVTATVIDDEGNSVSDTATAAVTLTDLRPVIAVSKSANPPTRDEPGGPVAFTVRVTNTLASAEPVTLTVLTDSVYGNLDGQGSCDLSTNTAKNISRGESYSCIFTATVPPGGGSLAGTYTDTVTATVIDNEGINPVSKIATATVTITDLPPVIAVSKSVSPTSVSEPGGLVTFTVRVTNTLASVEPVTLITLTDNVYGDLTSFGCATGTLLAIGDAYTCTFVASVPPPGGPSLAGTYTDMVTATVIDDEGKIPVSESATATVELIDVPPTITVRKSAEPGILPEPIGVVTFTVEVENTSFETVTLITLTDNLYGDLTVITDTTCMLTQIAPGDTYTCQFPFPVVGDPGDSYTDIVTATVSDDDGSSASASDSATVTIGTFCQEAQQLTDTDGGVNEHPSISSSGWRVAYISDRDGNPELFLYATTGPVPETKVTDTSSGVTNEPPAISGDGKYIAFASDASLAGNDGNQEIFRYDVVGEGTVLGSDTIASQIPGFNIEPSINYSGTRIAFASDHDLTGGNPDKSLQIFLYDSSRSPFVEASAGWYHTCGVREDGGPVCWGADWNGQASPLDGGFTQVSAGLYHTCGLRPNGRVECWGYNGDGQVSPPAGTFFSQVSAGLYHTCGVGTNGGLLACWGADWYGQKTPPVGTFSQVSAGGYHNCGIRTDNTLVCWGANWYGQASPPGGTFSQVSAGLYHTCGVMAGGTLACWGYNGWGQASPLDPVGPYTQVSAGLYHTCGVKAGGSVECWGYNGWGQALPLDPVGPYTQVSAGLYHTCGVKAIGSVECWGDNGWGQASPPVVSPGGPIVQVTTTANALNGQPAISGDGQAIAFVSDRDGNPEIFMASTSGGVTQITNTPITVTHSQPSISYDGQAIAFVSDRDGNPEIFMYTPSDGVTRVTTTTNVLNGQPSISGDGQRIAFVSNGDLKTGGNTDGNPEIFLARPGTGGIVFHQVTSTTSQIVNSHPSINRLGSAVAFVSDGDLKTGQNVDGNPEIFLSQCVVQSTSNLGIVKVGSAKVAPGRWFTYDVTVTTTPSAHQVVLTDRLEGPGRLLAAQPGCSNSSLREVICNFDELPGGPTQLIIWAQGTQAGVITNTVEVKAINAVTQTHTITTQISGADLSVQKTVAPRSVTPGEPLTYTVIVNNGGPDFATIEALTDTLLADAPVTLTIASVSPPGSCDSPVVNVTQTTVLCLKNLLLNPGQKITITAVIIPQAEGVITNTVDMFPYDPLTDPDLNNNTVTIVVGPVSPVYLPIILKEQ